ncbi:MAG: phytanoyl-CoA dioxygenase family protein [Pseudomonadota bacterium]
MAALQTVPITTPTTTVVELLERDGALILSDALSEADRRVLVDELEPFIEHTPFGGDDFTGRRTQRTGALAARTPACRPLITAQPILAAAEQFLAPFTERIQLHLTQTIHIHPGQGAQVLHRDRLAWGNHLPRSIEPQFNTIWALTDFTAENGATRVVPGSNHWPDEQRAEAEQICQAEMAAGSVLIYSGSVLHSGGENRSQAPRLGLNITYCLGWLRQEENQYLSCPPHVAKTLDPVLQELLGYTQGNYALGYYSDPDSTEAGRDVLPPELALGRMPRPERSLSLSDVTDSGVDLAQAESAGRMVGSDQF